MPLAAMCPRTAAGRTTDSARTIRRMTTPTGSATRDALSALTQAFFDAVSFEPGGHPPYESLHGLFIDGGLLIRNLGPVPEVTTVAQFIAPRQRSVEAGELT